MRRTDLFKKALALGLTLALRSVPALAAEPSARSGGAVRIEDAVCGEPEYCVIDLAGDGECSDPFDCDVP